MKNNKKFMYTIMHIVHMIEKKPSVERKWLCKLQYPCDGVLHSY